MAQTIGSAAYKLTADTAGLDQGLDKAAGKTRGFFQKVNEFAKGAFTGAFAGGLAGTLIGQLGGGALGRIKNAIETGIGDLGESLFGIATERSAKLIEGLPDILERAAKKAKEMSAVMKDVNTQFRDLTRESFLLDKELEGGKEEREKFELGFKVRDFEQKLIDKGFGFEEASTRAQAFRDKLEEVAAKQKELNEQAALFRRFNEESAKAQKESADLGPVAGFAPGHIAGSREAVESLALQRQAGGGQLVEKVQKGNELQAQGNDFLSKIERELLDLNLNIRSGIGFDLEIANP